MGARMSGALLPEFHLQAGRCQCGVMYAAGRVQYADRAETCRGLVNAAAAASEGETRLLRSQVGTRAAGQQSYRQVIYRLLVLRLTSVLFCR